MPTTSGIDGVVLSTIKNRNEFPSLLEGLGLSGVGVEVGVFESEYSSVILAGWRCREYHLVDTWRHIDGNEFKSTSNPMQEEFDAIFRCVQEKFASDPCVIIHRMESLEAARKFGESSLDFVFIDAAHDYESCKADVEAWWSKIREGGVIAGHDFIKDQHHDQYGEFGVRKAVIEFFCDKDFDLFMTNEDTWNSWYCIKRKRSVKKDRIVIDVGAGQGKGQSERLIAAGWKALLVEPCSVLYDGLVDRYADNDLVLCHNVAIAGSKKTQDLYYVHPDDAKTGISRWSGLLGSFSLKHVKNNLVVPSVRIVKEEVNCLPLMDSLEENGIAKADLLTIDTEGSEAEVVSTINFHTFLPKYVEVEVKHLIGDDMAHVSRRLRNAGYKLAPSFDAAGNRSLFAHCPTHASKHEKTSHKAVATMADRKFLPGLEVMIGSLLRHVRLDTKEWELVIISNDLREADLKMVSGWWPNLSIRRFDPTCYDGINKALNTSLPGANGSYHKFEVFGLDGYDKVVALDSDLLFLQNASELFKHDPPTGFSAVKELLIEQYNTGVMVIGPQFLGRWMIDELIEMTEVFGPREHADQDTISAMMWDEATELPVGLNFLKIYYNHKFLQKFAFPPHIKVLHYIIHKPWLWDWNMNEIEFNTEGLNEMWHKERKRLCEYGIS